uniref:2-cys peroxiredoxin, chloroplast (BAS1) n=1 Tax=Arundo donax TaxID=35708 RepID=A0A0A9GXE3_ARUDO
MNSWSKTAFASKSGVLFHTNGTPPCARNYGSTHPHIKLQLAPRIPGKPNDESNQTRPHLVPRAPRAAIASPHLLRLLFHRDTTREEGAQ